jgi:redox-sensing transcriptional repressor
MSFNSNIPPSVIKRMTKYLAYVQGLNAAGVEWVSSSELADTLGLTSSTVRQDLSHVDFSGTSKKGYETQGLEAELVRVLGTDLTWRTIVVGAGNLGRALVLHEDFAERGFDICGIFDSDKRKVGTAVGHLNVQNMDELAGTIRSKNVRIGVIAVPASVAQNVAHLLIAAKIRGLLNLALTHITAPKSVAVVDARIAASLMELSYAIKSLGTK